MDYSSRKRSVAEGPIRFESEAALKAFIEKSTRPSVRMSVEGFNPFRPEEEIKKELVNHFSSCGEVCRVIVPTEPLIDRRAFFILLGYGAEEKALQLNGSCIRGWNALVKVAPEEEEEEYKAALRFEESLSDDLLNDRRFRFGITVMGYDTSLHADEVKSCLTEHFSSCGEITHVSVCRSGKSTNIYFSKEEGEAMAMDLNGSEVRGFKITTRLLATVRSKPSLAPGETCLGYSVPAHMIEFAREIGEKVEAFKRIWRIRKKARAMTKVQLENFRVLKRRRILTQD